MTSSSCGTKIAICGVRVFLGWGWGYRLAHVGYCGAVNIGHDEDLELWLYLEYQVTAILVPVTKSELTEEGTWSEVLIFGRGMDDKNVGV